MLDHWWMFYWWYFTHKGEKYSKRQIKKIPEVKRERERENYKQHWILTTLSTPMDWYTIAVI